MILPSNSPITMPFGSTAPPYDAGSPHMGTDFAYTPDNTIYAPFSGTLILIPNNGRDGNGIYMYNGNQFHGMLHSSKYLVGSGSTVREGQPIGIMGDTGFAQGVHLHWCVKVNGQFIDPMTLVSNTFKSQGDELMTEKDVKSAFTMVLHHDPVHEADWQKWVGRPFREFADEMAAGPEWRLLHDIVKNRYPNDETIIADLREHLEASKGQVDRDTVLGYLNQNLK